MKVVLTMIAWNEADVIGRAIESCSSFIDHAVIVVDDRTKDGTEYAAESICTQYGIPLTIERMKWVDFATNRNRAMDLARESGCDYSLILDADEITILNEFKKDELFEAGYNSVVEYGGQKFMSLRLIRLDMPWVWRGVIHNYLECPGLTTTPELPSLGIYHLHDGYRSKDPNKVKKDVKILKKAVKDNPDSSRYWFYYAQTLRENGQYKESIEAYKKRISFQDWPEETWYSMYMIASQYQILDDFDNALTWYLKAYQFRPSRSEPVYQLAVYCRTKNYRHLSHMFSRMAIETKKPNDLLFIEFDVYEYLSLFEYAISCYWVGKFKECFDGNAWLIENIDLPENYYNQAKENLTFAAKKLNIETPWDNYSKPEGNRLIYFNDGMSTFGENYMNNYGFNRVKLDDADIDGLLWFGIYSPMEYDRLLATEKNINFHWCGSDVVYCINDSRIEELAKKTNINFTCENQYAQEELKEYGINAEVAAMFSEKFDDYVPGDYPKIWDVAVYSHHNTSLYNRELMIKTAEAMPDTKFVFFGDEVDDLPLNVANYGWVDQDQVKSILKSSKAYLRITEHDGFPDLMVKAHLLGLHVITNWDFPHCTVTDKESIIQSIKYCLATEVSKEVSYFYRMSGIVNDWTKIMKHGYDKFLQLQSVDQEGESGSGEPASELLENQ